MVKPGSYRMTDEPPLDGWLGVLDSSATEGLLTEAEARRLAGLPAEEPLAYAPRPPAVDRFTVAGEDW